MKNNETGEFELVVGDRQLLSAFFIVVLLCAVAFAMGYVVGQNGPHGKTAAEAAAPSVAASGAGDTRPQPLPPPPAQAAAAESTATPADGGPQPTTQPSLGSQPTAPEPQPAAEAPKPQPPSNGLVAPEDLPTGNLWQVMAAAPTTADAMAKTLKDHGFPVILSPAPRGLVRVLVGPYPDTQGYGKAKSDLEAALGAHPVRYKP